MDDSYLTSFDYQECVGSGPGVPETVASLEKSSAVCDDNLRDVRVGQALQLAPFCDSTGFFYADSFYIECGFGNQFYSLTVGDDFRYSCAETAMFKTSSTASEPKDLPTTTMMTDQQWREEYFLECVTFKTLVPTAPSAPSFAPRPVMTIMPVNIRPVNMPAAVAVAPAPRDISGSTEEKSNVGVIVGASVGAFVFLVISATVLFLLLWWRPNRHEEAVKEVSEHVNENSQTGYSGGEPVGGEYFGGGGEWGAQAPPMPIARAEVMPVVYMPDNHNNDHRVKMDEPRMGTGSPSSNEASVRQGSGSDTGGHHQYSYSRGSGSSQEQDTAVTFKDQAQSMIRPTGVVLDNDDDPPSGSGSSGRFHYPRRSGGNPQPDGAVAAPRYAPDQDMFHPDTIGIPTIDNDTSSAITEADTRGSSDPTGIYAHEPSLIVSAYGGGGSAARNETTEL
jgi:hypothetical protein